MQNEIVVNVTAGEIRVAILEKGSFVELHIERSDTRSIVGSIIKGRVTRVLPGMQAAFVDIGADKAAFLYVGDYFAEPSLSEEEEAPRPRRGRGRNGNGRSLPSIDTLLEEGQEIIVQVAKEPIGTKGARITSHVAVAGRHLVLTPWQQRVGVSRRIGSDRERRRLREILERLRPEDLGFIIRTAGEGTREADLEADIRYLTAVWDEIQIRKDEVRSPTVLYSEPSLPLRAIRDFANANTRRIVVDAPLMHEELRGFADRFLAEPRPQIEHYRGAVPIFDDFGLEAQIDANLGRKVWLKSGGYLIVDQSEALTAIDVNTGRFVGKRDLEDTVLKTNLEAVKEVVHQLRFRNIGGLIIIDLIDMESSENREKVYRALQEALRQDKAKTNILKISELGLVEMTRKRTRENLVQTVCEPCSSCDGRGYLLSRESVAYKVLREMRKDLPRFGGRRLAIAVHPRVAEVLLGPEKQALEEMEREVGREIEVHARPSLHQEQFELSALEAGAPVPLELPWLQASRPDAAALETGSEEADEDEDDEVEEEESVAPAQGASEPEPTPMGDRLEPGSVEDPGAEPQAASSLEPVDAASEFRILPGAPEREES